MRRSNSQLCIACLVGLAISLTAFPALAATEWTPEQKVVITVMERWQKAWDEGDVNTLDQLLPEKIDMTATSLVKYSQAGDGVFRDKTSFLNAYGNLKTSQRSTGRDWDISQKIIFLEVKISGDEAIVTRKIDWWQVGGRRNTGSMIKTGQLKKINGEWKFCAEKVTPR